MAHEADRLTSRWTPRGVAGSVAYRMLLRAGPAGFWEHLCHKARQLLVGRSDPPVTFAVAGARLRMPLSHDLPLHVRRFPGYSDNLRRLAAATLGRYPDLAMVDIGANIGDSLALVRRAGVEEVLCVEGAGTYLPYLHANAARLGGTVIIAPVLVGSITGELVGALETAHGTGRLTRDAAPAAMAGPLRTMTLDDLLAAYPLRGRIKLVKSDTDGFEAEIFQGGLASLRHHRPVLFFEYDPDMLARTGSHGLELLGTLSTDCGYSHALLYDNLGDLVLSTRLDDERLLWELHGYFAGHGLHQYLDIAAFHDDDTDLFESFRDEEYRFYGRAAPERRPESRQ